MPALIPIPPQVRQAQADDLDRIAQIHVTSWQTAYRGMIPDACLDALRVEDRKRLWQQFVGNAESPVFVSGSASGPAGFCHVMRSRDADTPSAAELVAIYVDPSQTRSGMGHALVTAAMNFAQAENYPAMTLWVLKLNQPARCFYESMGFQADGTKRGITIAGTSLLEMRYRKLFNPL